MGQRTAPPEGPVTIMFTDIEGSTALRTSLGDDEADALFREHDDLIRERIEAHGGEDQEASLGDGFLAIFASTRRAITCAVDVQRALDAFNRSRAGPPIRVRIGLNTGEVALKDGELSGEAVHAAARVTAIGSGGQVLVSDVTRQLAGTMPAVDFEDAGEHELKGFPRPWRLWEVVWAGDPSSAPEGVFVGRTGELAALREGLDAALDGRGGLVLVGGEPGVGKTALVKQLIREAERRGPLALFGRCYEAEGAVPYSPFVEMIEGALERMPPEDVREDMGEDAPEVARMVPELRRRFGDIPEPLDLPPEQQRRHFFNALASFIARGAERSPLVLVVDDVHWADEPTLLLVEHLASILPGLPVLGVGTYRDVELDVSRPLAASLERMLRERTVRRISVGRFDREDVEAMLAALSGKSPPEAVVEAVHAETEGNPFFVEEVYRHLVEEGRLFDESGSFRADLEVDELDVPESVRLVVGRRLERLGPSAQRALAAGAVIGRAFPFSLLEEMVDLDGGSLLEVVEEAEASNLLVAEERDGEVHFSFAHELIRQTLLAGLSILRRQRLHLAAANVIERLDPRARDERPSEIAHHLLRAGASAEPDRLTTYLRASARRAMEAAAFEEALKAVEDALSVAPEDDVSGRAELLWLLGAASRALGRFEECLEVWAEALDAYEWSGDRRAAAGLAYELGYLELWLGRFADGFASYSKGLELVGDERTSERALLGSGLATVTGLAGSSEAAEAYYREARDLAEELGDRRALGIAEWSRCTVAWSFCQIPESAEAGRRAVECLREGRDAWTLVDALAWSSFPMLFDGDRQDARRTAQEAIDLAGRLGHVGGEILARRTLALASAFTDPDLAAVEAAARLDLELCESIGSPWVSQSHAWISIVLRLRGEVDAALEHADEAIRLEPPSVWTGVGWMAKAVASAAAPDAEACRLLLEEPAPDMPPDVPAPMGGVVRTFGAAVAAARIGAAEHAERLYPLVAAYARRTRLLVLYPVPTQRIAGMAASAAGRWEEAEGHFAEARRFVDANPGTMDGPAVDYWEGRMLLDRGRPEDRDSGVERITRARDGFERLGMPLDAEMAEASLRR